MSYLVHNQIKREGQLIGSACLQKHPIEDWMTNDSLNQLAVSVTKYTMFTIKGA